MSIKNDRINTIMNSTNISVYDNGGVSFDRFTVVFLDRKIDHTNRFFALSVGESPDKFCQSCEVRLPNTGLGTRIPFSRLPAACRDAVRECINQE